MKTIASRTNSNPHQPLGEFVAGDFVMKRIGLAVAMLVFGFVARGFSQRSGGPGLNLPFRGLGAADNGRSYGSCGMSEVSFGVNQNTTHTDGKPFSSDSGYFSWYPADWCSGSYTYSAGLLHGDLTLRGNPQTLKASGQFSGLEYSSNYPWGAEVTVDVNMTFDASGNVSRAENTASFFSPWYSLL